MKSRRHATLTRALGALALAGLVLAPSAALAGGPSVRFEIEVPGSRYRDHDRHHEHRDDYDRHEDRYEHRGHHGYREYRDGYRPSYRVRRVRYWTPGFWRYGYWVPGYWAWRDTPCR